MRVSLASGMAARNEVFRKYREQAKKRNFLWEVTDKGFDQLTSACCHYCGLPPSNMKRLSSGSFTYSGIDRMDNLRGYEVGNMVSCCWECNRLKGSMPYGKFMAWLDRAIKHRANLLNMKPL